MRKVIFLCLLYASSAAATIPDPCAGPAELLALVNRPNLADSACAVPLHKAVVEMGYQYTNVSSNAHVQNFPQMVVRLGLPERNEFFMLLPNYYRSSTFPHTGFGAASIGFKHEIGYTEKWLTAADIYYFLPSGSAYYGSNSGGGVINGIATYSINEALSATFQLGLSNVATSYEAGGQHYTSINPILVLSWQINDKSSTYFETYEQSATGPGIGPSAIFDIGVLYLPIRWWEIDAVVGQGSNSGKLGFKNYVGAGMSFLLG